MLSPDDLRVAEEAGALRKGIMQALLACVLPLAVIIPLGLQLPQPAGAIMVALLLIWVVGAYGWMILAWRAYTTAWEQRIRETAPITTPASRLMPQTIIFDIARLVPAVRGIIATLVTGPPCIFSLHNRIVVAEELYRQTTDRDLLVLFIHEIGHHFAGHLPLLHLAQAMAMREENPAMRLFLLPTLPFRLALAEWGVWADVTADRLVLLLKPEVNLAILGVLKQVGLTQSDRESREHLVRFLDTAGGSSTRGDQLNVSAQLTDLFAEFPEVETRIQNLRAWRESEAYAEVMTRYREALAQCRKA